MATRADLVPRQPRDLIVRVAVEAGALLAVATAIMSPSLPSHFPFLELVLLLAVAAAIRWFGLALPGKGFASFVLGVILYAILSGGWSFGELLSRRLSLSAAGVNVGHLAVGSTLSGLVNQQLGASMGRRRGAPQRRPGAAPGRSSAAHHQRDLLPGTSLSQSLAFVDPKLTLRWQAVVYVLGAGLAFVWLEAMGLDAPVAGKGLLGIVLAGLVAVAH